MRSFRLLLAAILLAFCPWHHLGAQGPVQSLPAPPVPSKILPGEDRNVPPPGRRHALPPGYIGPRPQDILEPRPEDYTGPVPVRVSVWDDVFDRDLPVADALTRLIVPIRPVEIMPTDKLPDWMNNPPDWVNKVAPNGEKFKWVLTTEPKLWAIPILDLKRSRVSGKEGASYAKEDDDILKHVIVTRGLPVLSAGIARIQGDKIVIDNGSGHYWPTYRSLQRWAVDAFEKAGFKRQNIEDHDFIKDKNLNYFKE